MNAWHKFLYLYLGVIYVEDNKDNIIAYFVHQHHKWPVFLSFDVAFVAGLNQLLNKHPNRRWFQTPLYQYITEMINP